eukprot:500486-Alexandrium_andersonii.AAC.1
MSRATLAWIKPTKTSAHGVPGNGPLGVGDGRGGAIDRQPVGGMRSLHPRDCGWAEAGCYVDRRERQLGRDVLYRGAG